MASTRLTELVARTPEEQMEFFATAFISELGTEGLSDLYMVCSKFNKCVFDNNERKDLNHIQASHLLQQSGRTRTALERKQELLDVDVNHAGRIALIHYLLIHYKSMILNAYFNRKKVTPTADLSNFGIGVTGVGEFLVDELFTTARQGTDPALLKAIEEFMAQKRAKEQLIAKLEATAALGGVKGLAATNELAQLARRDSTSENRIEITLQAARRRSSGVSGEEALKAAKAAEQRAIAEKRRASRTALAARASVFNSPSTKA